MKNDMRLKVFFRASIVAAFILYLSPMISLTNAEVFIVAYPKIPEKNITKQDVEKIFTGKKSKWSDGTKIIPVVLGIESLHEEFTRGYVSKSSAQFKAYWNKMMFTGEGRPPQVFKTYDELIDYVSITPGAIGYIPVDSARVQKISISN